MESGGDLLSRAVSSQVPSALKGLTSVFGMGTGGSLRLLSPETKRGLDPFAAALLDSVSRHSNCLLTCHPFALASAFLQTSVRPSNGLPTSFTQRRFRLRYSRTSHPQNRTGCSASLRPTKAQLRFAHILSQTFFQDQALDLLVSSSSIRYRTSTDDLSTLSSSRGLTCFHSGNSILWVGFTLRCLQRLSLPHFASLLCHWHDNSCTRGASIPVLSY